jgi:hypothetical protein
MHQGICRLGVFADTGERIEAEIMTKYPQAFKEKRVARMLTTRRLPMFRHYVGGYDDILHERDDRAVGLPKASEAAHGQVNRR